MSPPTPQQQRPKNTPRKGRHPRRDSTLSPRNVKSGKNYASENDIPRDSTGVRTPMKGAPVVQNSYSGPKGPVEYYYQRTRNKGRPTSIATARSPAPTTANRTSPPTTANRTSPPTTAHRTSPPLTAGKSIPAAYAGAAFHASPAASALPIPSFMRARPGSPSAGRSPPKASNIGQEPSPPASDSEAPTPPAEPAQPKDEEPTQESPLDFFFRKDREEKKLEEERRSSRAHSVQGIVASSSPFSPPELSQPQSPSGPSSYNIGRRGNQPVGVRPLYPRGVVSGISPEELDGTPGGPIGPKFSTPFSDRIRAAKVSVSSGHPSPGTPQRSPGDGTHVLKSILNIADQPSIFAAHNGSPSPHPSSFGRPSHFAQGYHAGSPSGPRPTYQGLATGGQVEPAQDSVAMANTLKNLLKIQ